MLHIAVMVSVALVADDPPSNIRPDERVVLFPAYAYRDGDDGPWHAMIHGWVFEDEDRVESIARFCHLIGLDVPARFTAEFRILADRAGPFLVDNERRKRVVVRVGGATHMLPESEPDGHFYGEVTLDDEIVEGLIDGGGAPVADVRVALPTDDAREFVGALRVIPPSGVSVVCDIDDTIKISNVRDKGELLRNTFLRRFQPVEGMADLLRIISDRHAASFHYVSASPWQLYGPLSEFMEAEGFPAGTLHLKRFRLKDRSFFNLFRSPDGYKRSILIPLIERFPGHRFILIGDSGEADPEVYAALARAHPERVIAILIRDVTDQPHDDARRRTTFADLPETLWHVFRDPATIRPIVGRLGGAD